MATINLGSIKFKWQGAYNGATAYTVDDVVSYNGSSYICILASTGNLPTNATYWEQMSSAGTNGTDGTDLGTTLTTQGDIVYRNASGLARLGAGTSGQVLQTGGAGANPSWVDTSSGGAWTLLNTQTVSNAATLDFESLVSSTYNLYAIHIFDFRPATSADVLRFQTSENNGSTYNSANYQFHYQILQASTNVYDASATTGNASYQLANSVKSDDVENFDGILYISADFSSAHQPKFWHQGTGKSGSNVTTFYAGGGLYNGGQSSATNAFRLKFGSGNITSGTATLYGLAKS